MKGIGMRLLGANFVTTLGSQGAAALIALGPTVMIARL